MQKLTILFILFFAGLIVTFQWLQQSPNTPYDSATESETPHVISTAPDTAYTDTASEPQSIRENERAALSASIQKSAQSLHGTDINGGFPVDSNGHLIISPLNRDYFEYYLSTLGELPLDEILLKMEEDISANLTEPAKSEALELLGNYIELKRALLNLEEQVGDQLLQYGSNPIEAHKARLAMLSELRQQHLGSEASQAFYGETEAYDTYMLDRMSINQNTELSQQEKQQELLNLMKSAPEALQPRFEEEIRMKSMELEVAKLQAENADPQAIYAVRAEALGEPAATRLQALDERKALWQNRYDSYQQELQNIESSGLSGEELKLATEQLRDNHFEPNELRRVDALDRINKQASTKDDS
jgi:lipase chaperone LimK